MHTTELIYLLRNPKVIAFTTLFFGLILYFADQRKIEKNISTNLNIKSILFIGLFQILALIPGVSRAGITMTAGLMLGLDRNTAVKFSFFISVPIILAAALYEASNLIQVGNDIDIFNFIVTVILSALSSFFTIHLFLKFLDRIGMLPFVIYRLILGLSLIHI